MHRPLRRAAPAIAAILSIASCTSAPVPVPEDASSPTRGLGLQLWYAHLDTRRYEYFQLAPDGTLGYGGGMKAFNREVEWTGKATAEEAARVRAIVDAAGWLTAADPSRKSKASPVAEIVVRSGRADRAFEIDGPDEPVVQVVEVLSKAATRRFDRFMERLPEAGSQPRR